nr:uncharacterized protein LOC109174453 [Ipomoea batatas]
MATIWRPTRGMNVRELQPHRYLFRFFLEKDVQRIIDDGPWSYEQSVLILQRTTLSEDPESVPLNMADFWVQIHGLPAGFRSEAVIQAIGKFVGVLVKTDDRNFDGSIRQFFRVRVAIDVWKPLKKGMRMKKDSGEWFAVSFKYERLPTFCFLCGVLGHAEKFCAKDETPTTGAKPYSADLWAGNRRGVPTAGLRWIAPETTVERRAWAGPDCNVPGDDSGKAAGDVDHGNAEHNPPSQPAEPNNDTSSIPSVNRESMGPESEVESRTAAQPGNGYVSSLVVAYNELKRKRSLILKQQLALGAWAKTLGSGAAKKAQSRSTARPVSPVAPVGRISPVSLRPAKYAERVRWPELPSISPPSSNTLPLRCLNWLWKCCEGQQEKTRIVPRHIQLAVRNDEELSKLLGDVGLSLMVV